MADAIQTRVLTESDRALLDQFLTGRPATTMFMRSNLRAGTMTAAPEERYEAAYAGAFRDGQLVAVASHTWKHLLLLAGQFGVAEAARTALAATGRGLIGLSGPLAAVDWVRAEFGLTDLPTNLDTPEHLYGLDLADLVVPELLERDGVVCRRPRDAEFDLLYQWRLDYHVGMGGVREEAEAIGLRDGLRAKFDEGRCRVLERDGQLVSYTAFNAVMPDQVQIGGVWTPPAHRSRGYARAAVAGHLLDARRGGVQRAILFTAEDNTAAQRAYEALGFERIGQFGLVFFTEPATPSV